MFTRRLLLCSLLAVPAASEAQTIVVTLLGTGHPEPSLERFGPATLVEARGQRLLFDAGRGAAQRIWELATPVGEIRRVFLTHLHSDHVVGLPDVWLTGWLRNAFGRRNGPLQVFGPPGTEALARSLRQAYAEDVRARNPGSPDSTVDIIGHDVEEGAVYDQDGVRVIAFTVDHGNPPLPSFGYRVEHGGRSIVISGDTRRSENLIRFAQQTDLLIHEVMAAGPGAASSPDARRVLSSHTSPEEAGDVLSRVNPKLAVLTHVSIVSGPARRQAVLDGIMPRVRATYAGPLAIGEDRMTIIVGDSVEIRRPARPD
jgi:ribonuclease Z